MKHYKLDLLAVPNQRFNTTLNGQNITVELRTARGICYMSLSQDGKYIAAGIKCIPNAGLLTANVRRIINGDLMFVCHTDDYPSYEKFTTANCKLIYSTNE